MATDNAHLQRRHLTYYCVIAVPRPLRAILGKPKLVRSLKTHDLTEARKRRHRALVDFEDIIAAARKAPKGAPDADVKAVLSEAMELRKWGQSLDEDAGIDVSDAAEMRVSAITDAHGPEVASLFFRAAVGAGTPLLHHVDDWLAQSRYKPRSKGQHKGTLGALVRWCEAAGDVKTEVEAITRPVAGRFIRETVTVGTDTATINRKLSSFRAYWSWMVTRGAASENPWTGQSLPKKRAVDSDDDADNRSFTPDEMWRLLTGKPDAVLRDVMLIAALTGMRIESIAQLRVKDCGGGVFNIRRDKTAAGTRQVPIHSGLDQIIATRTKGRTGADWIFPECSPTDRGERSSAVSKRFHTYRRSLGVDDKPNGRRGSRVNFHSFRRWFITEAVRADPSQLELVRQIVGHKSQGMTMGVYFGGFTMDGMRRCVESVNLPTAPPDASLSKT